MTWRALTLIAALAVASGAAACGRGEPHGAAAADAPVHAPVDVARLAPVVDRYEAVGTVASKTTSSLASKIMGQVTAVHVREGDRVRAGQVVVEIEARDVAATVSRARAGVAEAEQGVVEADRAIQAAEQARAAAEANRDLARVTHERYARLLEARSASRQEFDEVEARFKTASAQLRSASSNVEALRARRSQALARIEQARAESRGAAVALGYAKVVAFADGVVTRKAVEVGMMATPGAPLLTIEDASTYRLEAAVEESYATRVRVGDEVPVRVDALGAGEVAGRVAEITPSADPASRTVVVKIDLPADPALRSGQYGSAAFPSGERNAVLVPRGAVVERGQLTGLFVVGSAGVARLRFVTLGKQFGDSVEILSGLEEGERFVTAPVAGLAEGRTIAPA